MKLAPQRKRKRRVQKKIDRRYGALHYRDVFIAATIRATDTLLPLMLEQNRAIGELNKHMLDIVKGHSERAEPSA